MPVTPSTSNLMHLADRIELDIQRRQLSEGQTYLTAEEAGRQFGVNGRTASRAMNLLADRRILVRRRGSGTFIGPSIPTRPTTDTRIAHVLIGEARLANGMPLDRLLGEMNRALDGVSCQLSIVPVSPPASFVESILSRGANGAPISGVVLVGCPREVHTIVAQAAVPAVVFGTVHTTARQLPSADTDHFAAGQLAASHLARSGAHRVAVILRDHWLPGDNRFLDGVQQCLSQLGVNHGSPTIRALPPDRDSIVSELATLLRRDDGPNGLICRGRVFAESALDAIGQLPQSGGDKIQMVAHLDSDEYRPDLPVACVTTESDYASQIRVVAALLAELIGGGDHDDEHIHFPVRLVKPAAKSPRTKDDAKDD